MKRLGFLPQKKENCTTRAKPSLTRAELAWPVLNREWPVPICTPRAENKLDTPRAKTFRDPCKPNEQHGPCWAARPVYGRMKMACLTDTPRVEDPCCFLPSASCCSAHSGSLVLTQNTNVTSPKPNHFKISPILPLIFLKSLPKP